MKKKLYFLLAASVAMFSACSSDDLSESSSAKSSQIDDSAVNFGAYVNRGITRAGAAGTLTTNGEASTVSLQTEGFGVFAYYTDSESYSETSKPNFMYNQKVYMEDGEWFYTPLKYWPNEFSKNVTSEGQDRLTFFAYAPYVTVNPSTGRIQKDPDNPEETSATSGIVALTSNTTSSDPYVKYYVDMDPDKRVDLCWGVAKDDFTASVDADDAANNVEQGWPYIDVVKPTTSSRINFDFKHALASVNVQIDTDIDVEEHGGAAVDPFTRIWVRSVTFEGFTDKGRLNLNSNASDGPQWLDLTTDSPVASGVVTVYDGRTDGKEGRENAVSKKETPATLNAKIFQSAPYDQTLLANSLTVSAAVPGVTNVPVNLFDAALTEPVYVIPTDDNLKVTIVYDVETADQNLATFLSDGAVRGSSVQNTIEKEISFVSEDAVAPVNKLDAGKKYIIKLHLGLTSVKFDASVTDWVDEVETNVDLPNNTASVFTKEDANDYNIQHNIADAWLYGEPRTYEAPDIAAHNADIDTWTAPRAKTQGAVYSFVPYMTGDPENTFAAGLVKVMAVDLVNNKTTVEVIKNPANPTLVGNQYYVEATDLTGGNDFELYELDGTPLGVSVKNVAKESDYSFDSYNSANNAPYGSGTVKQISQENGYTVVEVITNTNYPEQIGQQYAVHATSLDDATEFELLTVDGHAATGVTVKNVAAVADTQAEELYTDAEIDAHNALPAQQVWDEYTEWYPTDDEVTAHNQTVPGAAYVGCAMDANGNPIPANNDPGNDPGNDPSPSPYFSTSSASNNYPVLAPWRR